MLLEAQVVRVLFRLRLVDVSFPVIRPRMNGAGEALQSLPLVSCRPRQAMAAMLPPAQRQGRQRDGDQQRPQAELQPAAARSRILWRCSNQWNQTRKRACS